MVGLPLKEFTLGPKTTEGLSGRLREREADISVGVRERVRGRESANSRLPFVGDAPHGGKAWFLVFFKARAEVFWRLFSGMFQRTFS